MQSDGILYKKTLKNAKPKKLSLLLFKHFKYLIILIKYMLKAFLIALVANDFVSLSVKVIPLYP